VEDKRSATPTIPKPAGAQAPAQNVSIVPARSETPQQQEGSDEPVGVSLSLDEDYDALVRDSSRLQEFNVLLKQDLARSLRCVRVFYKYNLYVICIHTYIYSTHRETGPICRIRLVGVKLICMYNIMCVYLHIYTYIQIGPLHRVPFQRKTCMYVFV
jgi:hypothetical protein